jgi:hypothetical protein
MLLRASETRYNGAEQHGDVKYNNAGRVYQESLPYRGASIPSWKTGAYDHLDRDRDTEPDGKWFERAYNYLGGQRISSISYYTSQSA